MTSPAACSRCGIANSTGNYACVMCGARLPWADPAGLKARNPPPRAEIRELRPNLWLPSLLCVALSLAGAAFVLRGVRPSSLLRWHWPNNKPHAIQEDEIRVAVFKKMLRSRRDGPANWLYFLSNERGQDPSDSVMQQLAGYYPIIKKASAIASTRNLVFEPARDRATGQQGSVVWVTLRNFGQDKAEVRAGGDCDASYQVEWDGSQWIVGEARDEMCS